MLAQPVAIILGVALVALAVIAIRQPNQRRRIVAILIVGASVLVAFYVIVLGALAGFDTGGLPWQATLAALAVLAVGIVAAVAVIRGGRARSA
jgi:hypothetical protein